ncbi:hypothetical protein GCM10027418_30050 [Mariniluteicoccus endophyticus]
MVPQAARRPLIALAVATAAGFSLSGCAGIPGVTITSKGEVTPPPAPVTSSEPSSEPSNEPSARPTRTSYSPRPTTTRPSSPTSTRPGSTRPAATPTDDEDEVGAGYVRKGSVEAQISSLVREKTGQVAGVQCPDNLPAGTGATMTCKIVRLAGKEIQPQDVQVKVTGIEGRKVRFTMQVTSS